MKGRSLLVVPFVFVLALASCAPQRTPLSLDAKLEPGQIDEVVVLPVIDARPSPFDQVQVARNVEEAMVRYLRERGYYTTSSDAWNQRPVLPLDLRVATAEQLLPLSPEDASYIMIVQVERLEASSVPSADGRLNQGEPDGVERSEQVFEARISAAMVDRPHARVVWRDVATARSSLSGVLAVFSPGSPQYEAAVSATRALVETLPDKRPKKK